jgi:transcriptional regulator with XRE-family HTH domain
MTAFKDRFKELRQGRHLTQRELADALKISKSAVSMYEAGAREPDHETTEAIADYFNVDVDYLFGRSDVTMRYVKPNSYYDDPTVTALANKLKDNDRYRVLFDAASTVKPEDIDFVTQFIKRMGGDL